MTGITQNERRRRELAQAKAEVPGFDARTRIDDAIGKLIALRRRLRTGGELMAVLDDIDGLTDRAVELGLDPEAPDEGLSDTWLDPSTLDDGPGRSLVLPNSAASVFGYSCSCGGTILGDAVERESE